MRKEYQKIPSPGALLADFYKVGHREQYPEKTEYVFATWIARSNKHYPECDEVIALGFQGLNQKFLIDYFEEHFFSRPKQEVIDEYVRYCKFALFDPDPYFQHIDDLHSLGFIPIEVKALPEGTRVPLRVPMMVINNTDSRFFWVTNYVETIFSCELWPPSTTATIADQYRRILDRYAEQTSDCPEFVPFQGHDFSMRGAYGFYASQLAGIGHLTSFVGTDTAPAIAYLENYYNADMEKELIGCSVPATEHSVQCAGTKKGEYETYKRLITEVYPSGIISIVSDTWDLWNVVTRILPRLKNEIMARDGKVVIRPDSGDPVDIICGNFYDENAGGVIDGESPGYKGLIELLWDIFGGTVNSKGYKELDSHIGAIYGDSITPSRAEEICIRLEVKGFASTNVVLGIGSYTYQFVTRDSFGFAMKSTSCVVDGEDRMLFKDPKTDDGTKKSLRGACVVQTIDGKLAAVDGLKLFNDEPDEMKTIFMDGVIYNGTSLSEIRERIASTR